MFYGSPKKKQQLNHRELIWAYYLYIKVFDECSRKATCCRIITASDDTLYYQMCYFLWLRLWQCAQSVSGMGWKVEVLFWASWKNGSRNVLNSIWRTTNAWSCFSKEVEKRFCLIEHKVEQICKQIIFSNYRPIIDLQPALRSLLNNTTKTDNNKCFENIKLGITINFRVRIISKAIRRACNIYSLW